jgi:uncharacterized repeat protein (TIGR01451 family)
MAQTSGDLDHSGFVSAFRKAFAVLLTVFFCALGATAAHAGPDWVLNINDTGSDPTPAGGTVVYNVTVNNDGNVAAPANTITFSIPAGGTYTGVTGTVTGCTAPNVVGPGSVTCVVPALAIGETVTAAVSVLTAAQGTITVGASVPTAGDDEPGNNNPSQLTTITAGANLLLNVTGPATAASGGQATYVFDIRNLGPNTGGSMTLTVPVPVGLTNIVAPPGCTLSGSNYVCSVPGPLANGASTQLTLSGTISAAATSTLTVVGTVSGDTVADPITSNNTDTANTSVSAGTDVSISKARAPSGVLLVGDTATFTLSSAYSGDSPTGLVITDTIPANYSITSVTPSPGSGWTCNVASQVVTCNRTSGSGAGANVSLGSIEIATTIVSSGSPTNTASISASGPTDQNLLNNTANDGGVLIQDPVVDLRANKSGPSNPALVVTGQTYPFNISTTNLGNADFVGTIEMTDSLPAGLEVTAFALNGWTCTPAPTVVGPTNILCSITYTAGAPLAVGVTTPAVTMSALVTTTGTISNGLSVTSPAPNYPDPDLSNNVINYGVTATAALVSADLRVIKTAALSTVAAGDIQTFNIEIVNDGPGTSTGIVASDDLTSLINGSAGPTGAGFVSSSLAPNAAVGLACSDASSGGRSRRLSCSIASLPVCTAGVNCPVITVAVRPGGNAGGRTNTAYAVSNDVGDPDLADNSDSANYTIDPRADVTVEKVGSPDPAVAGQNLTYVVTATNLANGLSAAANTTVIDTLPSNVVFVSASPSSGTCTDAPAAGSTTGPGNNQVECNLGTLGNGAQSTVTIVVRPRTVTRGTSITNSVAVSTTTLGDNPANNNDTLPIAVSNPVLDILVNKDDSFDPLPVGDSMVYSITVTNNGPSAAENLIVTDTLPPDKLTFQSFSAPSGVTCPTVPTVGSFGGTLICTFPRLEPGGTRLIEVTMEGDAKGVTVNNVSVTSDEIAAGFDINAVNNVDTEDTTVRTRVDLQVASKTPSASPVNLRDGFNWVIVVRNRTGVGLAEADNTVVSDTLPANMVLTGPPVVSSIVPVGATTQSACTGAAGSTSFSCDFGTFNNGAEITITVPVKATAAASLPQTFNNTASVATTSFDINTANNSNSGNVSVNSSSLAGRVFRDFNADDAIAATDTGVSGVQVTLSGTAVDGTPITRTVTTETDGSYLFPFVPEGNYTLSRGVASEAHLTDNSALPGTGAGGSASGSTLINAVALPAATAGVDYNFSLIPNARVGIAKRVSAGPTTNADGTFNVTFAFQVSNLSLEALNNVTVTDALAGASPLFGTQVSLAAPATDPMGLGQYTVLASPSGTCGGFNAGFNGSGAQTLVSGATIAANGNCSINVTLRVRPTDPLPPIVSGGRYLNQANVNGVGALSGQTPSDLSDNGATADANGNGIANEAGENDPTPVTPTLNAAISLVKTGRLVVGGNGRADVGDTIDYDFLVTNEGSVTLTSVGVTDALVGTVSCPVTTLAPGASTTCTGAITLTQALINAGSITNTATATGTPPAGPNVSDISGTANNNDTQTVTPIPSAPDVTLVKTAGAPTVSGGALPTITDAGDTITYNFLVTNTGNVALNPIVVDDPTTNPVTCPVNLLAPNASTNCTASYTLTQTDIDAGEVSNTATVTGTPPTGADVTNASSITTQLTLVPRIALVKTVTAVNDLDGNGIDADDEVTYSFAVTNTGAVTLNTVGVTDAKVPNIVCLATTLAPGVATTCTGDAYVISQANVDAGAVNNTATASGIPPITTANPTPTPVTDISDEATPGTGPGNDDPTVANLGRTPSISLIKTAATPTIAQGADDAVTDADDTIAYSFIVTNTGNVTLTSVGVSDAKVGPVACLASTLAPGANTTCSASYTITTADMDAGQVLNTATASGTPPVGRPVTDISDELTPGPGIGNDDPTITPLTRTPSIALVKTAGAPTINRGADAGIPDAGDQIQYTFLVINTGNVTLSGVAIADTLTSTVICPVTTLAPGISTTCTGTLTLSQAQVSSGSVTNTATVTGTPPAGPVVQDISGSDLTNDTPTVTTIPRVPRLALTKEVTATDDRDGSGFVSQNDILTYRIVATNTGNTILNDVVVTDNRITPANISCAVLQPSESCTLTGTLSVTVEDVVIGRVDNTAQAVSDEFATQPLRASTSTPAFAAISPDQFTKVALVKQVKRGDRVPYVITAIDVPLNPARIVDIMPPGFSYVTGSASSNGVAVTPTIANRDLTFNGLAPDAGGDIRLELTLVANAASDTGRFVNRAQLVSPASGLILATATAPVIIIDEPVFDCGEVIGKVFDDRNNNGIQDAETSPYLPERGLAGVRVASVKGQLYTTDKNGQFHVSCADIPDADIGSNFVLKLDTRTLPTGYRITTENPRVVRLTRGKLSKLNFGASIGRVCKLDLNGAVFATGEARLNAKWHGALDKLVANAEDDPCTLRINYYMKNEGKSLSNLRVREVRKLIETKWAKRGGRRKMPIEIRILAAEGVPQK